MARNKFDIDEELESPFDIKHLKRAMIYVGRYKGRMAACLVMSLVAAAVGLSSPYIVRYALDEAVPEKNIPLLFILSGIMLATIIISVTLMAIRARMLTAVGQDIIFDIREDLFAHLQKLPFEYYDSRPHGKILVRVINYVNSVSDMLSNGIMNFVLELFSLTVIIAFMFAMHWRMSLVILAGVPVLMLVVFLIKNAMRRSWQQVSNKSSNQNAYLHEAIEGVRVTQMFVREEENARIFNDLSLNYRKVWMRAVAFTHVLWPSIDTVSAGIGASIYLAGLLVMGPELITFGTIVAMFGYAMRFWQPILNLSNTYTMFINNVAYLERIFEAMDEPVTVSDKENAYELPKIKGSIAFENVTFSYDESKVVLENLSFSVKSGESIALVGPTGAGKTTIVNLISRFYNCGEGKVLIDGHDISEVTLKSLRSQMGVMLQDSVIFSGTIIENIRYGRLDATDKEIKQACKTVRADRFISEFENGYKTEVAGRGTTLSQGQKQLISFARTLLADPKILILDEATSSIDAKTEKLLQEGLAELLKGRTSFIIAHRLSTIKNCDKIMYISNKGITEAGTHDELIAKKGDYYKLHESMN